MNLQNVLDGGEKKILDRPRRLLLSAAVVSLYIAAVSQIFSWVYLLNDDRFIKEVLSGVYNGTPDGHVIFMKYPFGWAVKTLYTLLPGWDWYGIVLAGIGIACLFLLVYRCLGLFETWQGKLFLLALVLIFYTAAWLPRLLAFTYTTVAAMAGATALFWYGSGKKSTLAGNAVTAALAVTAYLIRDSVFFMLLPFAGILFFNRMAGLSMRQIKTWLRELILPAALLLLLAAVFLADKAAYSGSQWQRILGDADARSVIYNYCGPAGYEEHQAFYEEAGISRDTYEALVRYNLIVDEDLNTENLYKIAAYSEAADAASRTAVQKLKDGAALAWYGAMKSGCQPLNWAAIAMLTWLIIWAAVRKDKKMLASALALLFVWLALWLCLGYAGRLPRRVAEGLHMCGLLTAAGLYLQNGFSFPRGWKKKGLACIILAPFSLALLINSYKTIGHTTRQTLAGAGNYQIVVEYCWQHPDLFYLADVYSMVGYGDVFTLRDDTREMNYLPLGDWLAFSPMYEEKLESQGIANLAEDIVEKGNIRIICRDYYDMGYLLDYYLRHGLDVEMEITDRIEQNGEAMDVYQFRLRKDKKS